jgi:hypothetical protein
VARDKQGKELEPVLDANGSPLAEGDQVQLTATVVRLSDAPDDLGRNVRVELDGPDDDCPPGLRPLITMHAAHCLKIHKIDEKAMAEAVKTGAVADVEPPKNPPPPAAEPAHAT